MNSYQSPIIAQTPETSVIIMAHLAVHSFAMLMSDRWQHLGPVSISLPIPEEDAHAGPPVWRRFLTLLERALGTDWKTLVVAEYDTLALGQPRISVETDELMSCWWVLPDDYEFAALSPWVFGRQSAERFVTAGHACMHVQVQDGLLDRWIGYVAKRSGVLMKASSLFHGHPPEAIFTAVQNGAQIVHPVKDMADVRNLEAIYHREAAGV